MIIKTVELSGFRSFRKAAKVVVGRAPGLYHVSGWNKAEPALGANGAGKSTIWDGLTWAFFGKTLRGLKAGNVATWDIGGGVFVVVEFECNAHKYRLARTWGPNTLNIATDGGDPRPVQQEELEKILGLDAVTWEHTVVIGQFTNHFLDQTPTERLTLFSRALNLDLWLKAADEAKQVGKALTVTHDDAERACERLRGRADSLRAGIRAGVAAADVWEAHRVGRADVAHQGVTTARQRVLDITTQGRAAKAAAVLAKQSVAPASDAIEEVGKLCIEARVSSSRADDVVSHAADGIAHAQKQLAKYQRIGPVCTLCKQPVEDGHAERHLEAFAVDVAAATKAEASARKIAKVRAAAVATLYERQVKAKAAYSEVDALLRSADEAVSRLSRDWSVAVAECTRFEETLAAIQVDTNPHTSRLAEDNARLEATEADRIKLDEQIKTLVGKIESAEYWVAGFKDLRLWLITNTLAHLEVEANNSMRQLGMDDWTIRFEIEAENKSGGVSRGFLVFVQAPGSAEGTPWESWSGGESQRLRIATAAGLANLIRTVRGVACNVEVWDEPTAHLSGEGIEQLLDFLHGRAEQDKRSTWLVDHRSLDYGGFAAQLVVVKDQHGSQIKEASGQVYR